MEANCVKCDCPLEQPVRMYGLACNYFDLAVCLCGDCHEWMLGNLDDACIMVYLDGEELKEMMTAKVQEEEEDDEGAGGNDCGVTYADRPKRTYGGVNVGVSVGEVICLRWL